MILSFIHCILNKNNNCYNKEKCRVQPKLFFVSVFEIVCGQIVVDLINPPNSRSHNGILYKAMQSKTVYFF